MLTRQDITQFNGFGQGEYPGKYWYSENLKHTGSGIVPNWQIFGDSLTGSNLTNWFTEDNGGIYSVTSNGDIFTSINSLIHSVSGSVGNGLIVDQKNRLLYATNQYLGKYESASFTDTWKDFTISHSDFRPMELYEDMVLIGNKNNVAVLFTDDSFNISAFSVPSNYVVRCIKAGKNGVLLGVNVQNRGYLILWDGYATRSIAPWIPLKNTVSSITVDDEGNWIVVTANQILITNGYTTGEYAKLPNENLNLSILTSVIPAGTIFCKGKLMISFSPPTGVIPITKMQAGVMIYDSETRLWEFVPTNQNWRIKTAMGAIYRDTSQIMYISNQTIGTTSNNYVSFLREQPASKAVLVTGELGAGNNPKVAEAFIASLRFSPSESTRYSSNNWTLTAKIYDFKRQLSGYALTNGASTSLNQIKNTGSNVLYQSAQVGDEITVLNGVNAGQIRHITAIASAGTITETWTLDSNLPNLTESGVYVEIMPFRTIDTKTITEAQDYFFNIQNRPKGKRFLIKLIFETTDTNRMLPELGGMSFIYDDKPIK